MERNSHYAVKLGIRYLISAVIAFFVYLSIVVIFTGMFTKVVGYTAYNAESNEVLYHYYESEGEDLKKAEYEAQGIEVSTVDLRSTLSGKPQFFADFIGQTVAALIILSFAHSILWKLGDSDSNLVAFEHIAEDKLRGFKIGALATVPGAAAFLLAVIAKIGILPASVIALYRFVNYQFFTLGNLFFTRSLTDYSAVSWGRLLSSASIMLLLPIISGIMYILGYNHITLQKYIYKKKKDTE